MGSAARRARAERVHSCTRLKRSSSVL
jgi:hypothetical protein